MLNRQNTSPQTPDPSQPIVWNELDDPATFWVRFRGKIFAFPIVNGMVRLDDEQSVTADEFRKRLTLRFGAGEFVSTSPSAKERLQK